MEHWPADERLRVLPVKTQGRSKNGLHAHDIHYWNHPCLEYGTFGGMTLISSNGRLAWATVVDVSRARRVASIGIGHCVFPAARPVNPPSSNLTQWKRIKEGLSFVRTCFPDADFPAELVKAEFQFDEQQNQELQIYDPLRGNLVNIVPSYETPQTSFVLFPVGDTSSELNVSFTTVVDSNSTFHASGRVAFKFETPILQIPKSRPSSSSPRRGVYPVLVRTHSATSLLNIEMPDDGTDIKATREVDISSDDVGGKGLVDAAFSLHHSDIMVVNASGAVYNCTVYQGGKAVRRVGHNIHLEGAKEDKFWRLRPSNRGCFLASSSWIKHLDFRTNQPAVDLFSTDGLAPAVVTSFDLLEEEHLFAVSTTSELMWLDDRYAKKSFLSFKHNRAYDRSLDVGIVQLNDGPLTFLSSLKNKLVTVYDVSRGNDRLIHCHSVPGSLPFNGDMGTPDSESTFFVQPDMCSFSLFRFSSQGSLHCQDFTVCRSDMDILPRENIGNRHEWSADVEKLAQKAKGLRSQYGPLSARHFSELNLRPAYQKIFLVGDTNEQAAEGELLEMKGKLSQFSRNSNDTDKAMLTLYDICLGANGEPDEVSRAGFFASGVISSNHVYKALVRNELPVEKVASSAAWRCDFKPFLRRMGLGRMDHWGETRGHLKAFNLSYPIDAPEFLVQQEGESQEQLVVDLALSSMALSTRPISAPVASIPVDGLEAVSLATKALTLDDEPPDIQPGYLRPHHKFGVNHYPDTSKGKDTVPQPKEAIKFSTPLGVRLLLKEWEVGTDVESYTYRDPYNTKGDDLVPPPPRERIYPAQVPITSPQRPPVVAAGFVSRPPPIRKHLETFGSQPEGFAFIPHGSYPESSEPTQELVTNTQVLPGPHGGRPAPQNKKPVKKRVGGF